MIATGAVVVAPATATPATEKTASKSAAWKGAEPSGRMAKATTMLPLATAVITIRSVSTPNCSVECTFNMCIQHVQSVCKYPWAC